MNVNRRENRRNKVRSEQLSVIEKKNLATLIRNKDVLWNPANASYKDIAAHEKAWHEIANDLNKSVGICKASWRSLRDCYRYRRKVAERMQANGQIEDPLQYVESSWEFSEELSFLSNVRRTKGKYITYTEDSDTCTGAEHYESTASSFRIRDELQDSPASKKPRLDYIEQSYENHYGDETAEYVESMEEPFENLNNNVETTSLITQLGKLVDAQTEFMREFKCNGLDKLAFQTQLVAVDALLQQLPKKTAQKTLIEMQNYVLKKVNEYQRNKSDSDF